MSSPSPRPPPKAPASPRAALSSSPVPPSSSSSPPGRAGAIESGGGPSSSSSLRPRSAAAAAFSASPPTAAGAGAGGGGGGGREGAEDSPPASPIIPDRASSPDLPLTMTASTVLMALPRDATAALAAAGAFDRDKIIVRFKPVGSAPAIRPELRKISATQKFDAVVSYLRRILRLRESETVFLYVNSTFAPALDEVVGNLHRCFKDSSDQLNVAYSLTPAFG